ncbi:Lipid A export ATP-binding/permease protein msbA (fragment) [Capnocytophaga canimorsus]|uniref:Lipid A export ATP-binding/permease protein msbA n=1 Tax=Capnocytophaga canimorsus TaxID=28188 RepID=A0A0B7HCS8_9FLAO
MSSYLKRFIPFILPYKKHVALNIVFSTLYALFSALSFVALVPMLDIMFNKEATKVYEKPLFPDDLSKMGDYAKTLLNYEITQVAGNNPIWALGMMIGLVITMFLLKNLFNYLAIFFVTFLRNGVLRDLRNKLYKKVTELPISYFSEQRKGDIISRISGDVNEVQSSFLSVLELIFREPLTIIFSIMAMLAISAKLTLFVFIFIPISGLIISKIGKSLKKQSTKVQEEQGRFLSLIEETVGGLRIIKAFNAEKIFNKRFQESTQRFHHFANSLMNRQNLASPVSEFLGILVIAILLWFGGSMVLIEKTLDGSEFYCLYGVGLQYFNPSKSHKPCLIRFA